jgi:hypothetical protein
MAAGNLNLLQDAKEEMDLMGPNAAMQGKSGEDASGRAILAQQQGGMVELTPALNRLRSLKLRTYRLIWNLIRQTWTEQRWIRVTDDERKTRFVGLNRPVTLQDEIVAASEQNGDNPQELMEVAQQQGHDLNAVLRVENVPADMDMDIIIDEAPDIITMQAEQFEALTNMVAAGFPIPPDVVIEASSLRNKEQLLEKMRGGDNPQAQQAAQQQQEMQMRGAEAEIRKTESEALENEANAFVKVNFDPMSQPGSV